MIYFVFMTSHLNDEEQMLVDTVRAFIDRDVKPTVNEVEHANEYPEAWIEQMKEMGIYGLAVPEEYDGLPISMPAYVQVTEELAPFEPDSGAYGGGHHHHDSHPLAPIPVRQKIHRPSDPS